MFITPEMRMHFTKCELEYIDDDCYETPYEEYVVSKAINIIEKHLKEKDYDIRDEDELETIQLALLTMEKYKEEMI